MSRLPIPGQDDNTWGTILNDFLSVSLNNDGTVKNGVIGDAQISDVTQAKVTGLATTFAAKANDSAVIHNTGNESIGGVKTFVLSPTLPTPTGNSDAATKAYVDQINKENFAIAIAIAI